MRPADASSSSTACASIGASASESVVTRRTHGSAEAAEAPPAEGRNAATGASHVPIRYSGSSHWALASAASSSIAVGGAVGRSPPAPPPARALAGPTSETAPGLLAASGSSTRAYSYANPPSSPAVGSGAACDMLLRAAAPPPCSTLPVRSLRRSAPPLNEAVRPAGPLCVTPRRDCGGCCDGARTPVSASTGVRSSCGRQPECTVVPTAMTAASSSASYQRSWMRTTALAGAPYRSLLAVAACAAACSSGWGSASPSPKAA